MPSCLPSVAADPDLVAQAGAICTAAGLARPSGLEQLSGGRNNRVFRLELVDGDAVILKSYYRDDHDPRDRLSAEWDFLTFAWSKGARNVPRPIARDDATGIGIYGLLEGRKLTTDAIASTHIEQAATFICAINRGDRPREALKPGSEACFSIADHLGKVDRRMAGMGTLDPQAPYAEAAAALITDTLIPGWQKVKAGIVEACAKASLALDAPITEREVIVSPSDFGFHNALWDDRKGLGFLDFEYAGWDDPAKLAGDFFNCPEIPVPARYFDMFVETLCWRLDLGETALTRMVMLRDVYRLKWACIILNDFLPHDDARRRFADQGDRAARCAAQLAKAAALISGRGTN
ncbi:MAG: phosphotransferase [Inquilinaceae bacterium]